MNLPEASPTSAAELARLGLQNFVALDLETTGFDPKKCRAIEFGAVKFEGGEEVDAFSRLVHIDEELPPEIIRLTGITDEDLVNADLIEDVLPDFAEFVGNNPIVGQNINFDTGFIEAEIKRLDLAKRPTWKPGPIYDTLHISRAFFPLLKSFGLSSLSRVCEVNLDGHHRADNDARATALVLLELLKRARRIPFGELHEMSRIIGASNFTISNLIDGLTGIGPGDLDYLDEKKLNDNRIGRWGSDPSNETGDSTEPINIENWFATEGPLADVIDNYECRDGQVKMAQAVGETLDDGGFLMAEAGTGTGKSFAYMLPSYLHSRNGGGRVIVSTYTRHLQDQLFYKDLPALNNALGGGIRATLLKGRSNYICKRRFDNLIANPENLTPEEKMSALSIVRWLGRTKTGDKSEISGIMHGMPKGFWGKITAESGFCTARVCRGSDNCFLHKVRTSALSSHLVLVNHALLFSDLAANGGVLGEYDRVVFDEAHQIEKVAASHLGHVYHHSILRAIIGRLYDNKSQRGLLARLKPYADRIYTALERGDLDSVSPLEEAIDATINVLKAGEEFTSILENHIKDKSTGKNFYSQRVRYRDPQDFFAELEDEVKELNKHFKNLIRLLSKLYHDLEEEDIAEIEGDDLTGELQRLNREVTDLWESFQLLTGEYQDTIVYWYEQSNTFNIPVKLYGAPIDVGEILQEKFYPKIHSGIFTSATLTVNDEFEYIAYRIGIDDEYRGEIFNSPFDMNKQLLIAVTDFMDNPKRNEERFTRGIARLSYRLSTELDAGTLSLFTSTKMLRNAYDLAKPDLKKADWMLLGQSLDGGQVDLLEKFKLNRQSVLFGLDSFWEGVDVPGDALELLLIAKLPFAVPSDPLIEARCELIDDDGGNSFIEYSVPEVALKLKQGIGRLIRTTKDVGVAVICDPRISNSRWGKMILNSLPVSANGYRDYDHLYYDLSNFLGADRHKNKTE